jgi:hypothetical protein
MVKTIKSLPVSVFLVIFVKVKVQFRIRRRMRNQNVDFWMLIRFRIRRKVSDLYGSGSTTLFNHKFTTLQYGTGIQIIQQFLSCIGYIRMRPTGTPPYCEWMTVPRRYRYPYVGGWKYPDLGKVLCLLWWKDEGQVVGSGPVRAWRYWQ